MSEKILNSRIVHKHDSESNWNKAINFVPKQGELIIYDKDETHDYVRIKVGDGTSNVNDLPFIDNTKVDKVDGKQLSTNDYTTEEKNKLAGIENGANKTVVDDALSTTSTNPVQNKIVTTEINGIKTLVGDASVAEQITAAVANKADLDHTHDEYALVLHTHDEYAEVDHTHLQTDIKFGTSNSKSKSSLIDGAYVDEFSANRFAFMDPDYITIEYSNDSGETWIDYGATDEEKIGLVTDIGATKRFFLNGTSGAIASTDRLRVTFALKDATLYCYFHKLAFLVNAAGRDIYCNVLFQYENGNTAYETTASLSGSWIGWNTINTPSIAVYNTFNSASTVLKLILTFTPSNSSSDTMYIQRIMGFGEINPNFSTIVYPNTATNGHVYKLDSAQNAIFPAKVTVTTAPVNNMDVATKEYVDSNTHTVSIKTWTTSDIT